MKMTSLDKVSNKLMREIAQVPPVRNLEHIDPHTDFKADYRKIDPAEPKILQSGKYQGRVHDSYI